MTVGTKIHLSLTSILLIVCVVLAFFLSSTCNKIKKGKQFESMYVASQDTLHKTRNALGQEVAVKDLLYGDVSNFKKLIAGKDSTLAKLQKIVDRKTISATVLDNSTSNEIHSHTNTITGHDTIRKHDTLFVYPEYSTIFKNRWEDFNVKANRDTFLIDYKVFNEFEIEQKFEKQKVKGYIFKQDVPVIQVTNSNPNTVTNDVQSFNVSPPKNSSLKKILVGVGVGLVGGYFAFHH